MQIEPSLRASDADREQVAERLRHATAEGRLSADELEGRLHTLFAARTYGELEPLLADLPTGRSPGGRRVPVGKWAAAVGTFTLMLAVFGVLTIARVHSAAAAAGPGGTQFRFRPPLADPTRGLVAVASMLGVFAVLVICGMLAWVLMQSRGNLERPSGPTSGLD
jgi:hypothetical protein